MCQTRTTAFLCAVVIAAFAFPIANAATISATAETNVNAVIMTDTDNGPGSALAQASDVEADALAAADDSGRLATSAAFSGANGTQAVITATASWSDTFSAAAGTPARFDFFVPGGAIGFEANNVKPLKGGYTIEIEFNGAQVFFASGEVETADGSPEDLDDVVLTQTGTVIGSTFANGISDDIFASPGAGYLFDAFRGSLDLVTISGDNTITYAMTVFVEGLIGETSALASIGDPLDLTVNPGIDLQLDSGPVPQQVEIDIKPGSDENPINLKSNGVIPVAVLGSIDFDATQIDYETVAFGPGGAGPAHKKGHVEDSNDDGFMDMVFHFRTQETDLSCDDSEATLSGSTFDGTAIEGSDTIRINQCDESRSSSETNVEDSGAAALDWLMPILGFALLGWRRASR